jgi:hypothetical protein
MASHHARHGSRALSRLGPRDRPARRPRALLANYPGPIYNADRSPPSRA